MSPWLTATWSPWPPRLRQCLCHSLVFFFPFFPPRGSLDFHLFPPSPPPTPRGMLLEFPPNPLSPFSDPSRLHWVVFLLFFQGAGPAHGIFGMGWMGWGRTQLGVCGAGSRERRCTRSSRWGSAPNPLRSFGGDFLNLYLAFWPFLGRDWGGGWGWGPPGAAALVVHNRRPPAHLSVPLGLISTDT